MTRPAGGPCLLVYSQDGLGLGHLRRTTLLSAAYLAAEPAASVLTLCDSPLGPFFQRARGHDYLKLPSIRKIRPGEWSPISLAQSFADVLDLRARIITATALAYRPDVLLVDHMPHGAMGELVPTLKVLRESGTRMVLGLRDILDAPETIRRGWKLEGAFAAVEEYFDEVLVYGSQDVFDIGEAYDWPLSIRHRLRYCGYVCSPPPTNPVNAIRQRYLKRRPGAKLVVGMAGGGADATDLFDMLARSSRLLASGHYAIVVVTGPFFPPEERARLIRDFGDRVKVVTSVPDPLAHMQAADLVVAMAGYNTTAEILSTGVRALLVPRRGPSAEQQMRAMRFAARGWVRWLPPETLSEAELASAIEAALDDTQPRTTTRPDLGGLRRAALHLLDGHRQDDGGQPEIEVGRRASLGIVAGATVHAEPLVLDALAGSARVVPGSRP